MSLVYFISHPEVRVDTNIPVPEWDLSEKGKERLEVMLQQPWVLSIKSIFSSNEIKAKTAAHRLGEFLHLENRVIEGLGEMDRSATGFLAPEEFEQVVNEAFAHPDQSIRGWEKLEDAQQRIIAAVNEALSASSGTDNIAIVSHGGVGTLLICHLKNIPVSRAQDQPGQGHYFVFDSRTKQLLHSWKKIDA